MRRAVAVLVTLLCVGCDMIDTPAEHTESVEHRLTEITTPGGVRCIAVRFDGYASGYVIDCDWSNARP